MDSLLRAALRYAAAGWPVFPCKPGSKVPHGILVPHGVLDASTAPDRIAHWWACSPLANVGIACGAPGPDVIDFDVAHGKPGRATYARLDAAGLLAGAYLVVTTPSGGWHLYFAGSTQRNGSIPRHGVDFRSAGGYVVAPPSLVDGRPYTVTTEHQQSGKCADFDAVRRVLEPPRPTVTRPRVIATSSTNFDALIKHVANMPEGNGNNALYWAACRAAETQAPASVFDALVEAAVSAGHPRPGAVRTVESARRRLTGSSR